MLDKVDSSVIAGAILVPAAAFALAYSSILTKLSRALASPYAKADLSRRLSAATVDGLLVLSAGMLFWNSGSLMYLVAALAYVLLRDAVNGQSVGKFVFGLVVIDLHTGRPSSAAASARRNLLFLLPGANAVAVFLETRTIVRDRQGQRLGDKLAQTQVVEGFGARDLVRSFQELLMSIGADGSHVPGRRRRAPLGTERAA
jgi:uncharacterized RDD family membrane protein YckC